MAEAPVDIPIQVKGLTDVQKLERRMEALEKEVTRLNKQLLGTGVASKAAGKGAAAGAVGVKAFGAAVKTALGPISLVLSAIGGLGAAFNTLKGQDFSEAKFETLGGNADQLVTNLKAVSNELQGTASVAELTGAAYDVASAGFSSAAEASLVLKAASLGATGGFSDLNTVANATTSVLNAYGQSAADAGKLVDQFIQTQNDGKIVVAQYADNIGKVASVAAGLKIPLSEINAVIAQSTAAGNNAEVTFTGLKGALARLASGDAAKALKDYGIEISAATLESEGLLGTLKKLEGLDQGTIFKALGTESTPVLSPVLQDLEKYEELILNQEKAQGVAAAAAATAAGTIEGAWKRVTVAFENLFADQSEVGQAIRAVLLMAAATVEALAASFKTSLAPIRAVLEFVGQIAQAITGLKSGEQVLQKLTALWFQQLQRVQEVSDTIIAVGRVAGQYVGELIQQVTGWFSELWTNIAEGASGVIKPIVDAFAKAFQFVKGLIDGFYNLLPDWLKDALGGVGGSIQGAFNKVVSDIKAAAAQVQIAVPGQGGGGGGGSVAVPVSGGAGGGSGAAEELKKQREELERQFEAGEKIKQNLERQMQLLAAGSDLEKERLRITHELEDTIARIKETAAPAQQEGLIMSAQELARIKDAQAILESSNWDEMSQWYEDQSSMVQELSSEYQALANSIAGSMTGAFRSVIDGSKSAEEAFADMLKAMGDALIDYATQAIAQYIAIGIAKAFAGMGGGESYEVPDAAVPKTSGMSFFAEGGYVDSPTNALIGEAGESEYVIPASKMDGAMARYSAGQRGASVVDGAAGDLGSDAAAIAEAPLSINISGGVTQMGGNDYIRQDQLPSIIGQASKAGEARALRKLRQSPSTRRSVGL